MAYETELELAKSLAFEAGEIMRKYFDLQLTRDWKSDGTPVTVADTEINALVINRIQQKFPGDSAFGEEQSAMTASVRLWVCDPVDGTMPYSHGLQVSTFSLALVVDGVPEVGVIYDPFGGRLFSAVRGEGSFCNDVAIRVGSGTMRHALLDVEAFPATGKGVTSVELGAIDHALRAKGAHVTCLWSVILPMALVAAGEYGGVVFNLPTLHDVAAAKVIVEEAGGTTSDLFGDDQRYDGPIKGFIACKPAIHADLVEIVRQANEMTSVKTQPTELNG